MSNKQMQTYVAYIVPSPQAPEKGVAQPVAVASRDIAKLDIPVRACGFFFYDAPAHVADATESLNWQENASKVYLLANTLMTREDVKTLIAGPPHTRHNNTMQWDPRIEFHDRFVITRNNAVQPVTDRHVVINSDKKQLWPAFNKSAKPQSDARMDEMFNPVLQKNIVIKKPLKLKPPKAPGK